jgi:hypothetical protein
MGFKHFSFAGWIAGRAPALAAAALLAAAAVPLAAQNLLVNPTSTPASAAGRSPGQARGTDSQGVRQTLN